MTAGEARRTLPVSALPVDLLLQLRASDTLVSMGDFAWPWRPLLPLLIAAPFAGLLSATFTGTASFSVPWRVVALVLGTTALLVWGVRHTRVDYRLKGSRAMLLGPTVLVVVKAHEVEILPAELLEIVGADIRIGDRIVGRMRAGPFWQESLQAAMARARAGEGLSTDRWRLAMQAARTPITPPLSGAGPWLSALLAGLALGFAVELLSVGRRVSGLRLPHEELAAVLARYEQDWSEQMPKEAGERALALQALEQGTFAALDEALPWFDEADDAERRRMHDAILAGLAKVTSIETLEILRGSEAGRRDYLGRDITLALGSRYHEVWPKAVAAADDLEQAKALLDSGVRWSLTAEERETGEKRILELAAIQVETATTTEDLSAVRDHVEPLERPHAELDLAIVRRFREVAPTDLAKASASEDLDGVFELALDLEVDQAVLDLIRRRYVALATHELQALEDPADLEPYLVAAESMEAEELQKKAVARQRALIAGAIRHSRDPEELRLLLSDFDEEYPEVRPAIDARLGALGSEQLRRATIPEELEALFETADKYENVGLDAGPKLRLAARKRSVSLASKARTMPEIQGWVSVAEQFLEGKDRDDIMKTYDRVAPVAALEGPARAVHDFLSSPRFSDIERRDKVRARLPAVCSPEHAPDQDPVARQAWSYLCRSQPAVLYYQGTSHLDDQAAGSLMKAVAGLDDDPWIVKARAERSVTRAVVSVAVASQHLETMGLATWPCTATYEWLEGEAKGARLTFEATCTRRER